MSRTSQPGYRHGQPGRSAPASYFSASSAIRGMVPPAVGLGSSASRSPDPGNRLDHRHPPIPSRLGRYLGDHNRGDGAMVDLKESACYPD